MNKERRYELYDWVIDKFYDRESIASIQIAARDLFKEHQLNSIEEMMFLEDLACELHHVKMSYLVVDKPTETDIWRENLKAWSLKQREEKPVIQEALEIALNNFPYVNEKGEIKRRESFTDDLQKMVENQKEGLIHFGDLIAGSHYKGEF